VLFCYPSSGFSKFFPIFAHFTQRAEYFCRFTTIFRTLYYNAYRKKSQARFSFLSKVPLLYAKKTACPIGQAAFFVK